MRNRLPLVVAFAALLFAPVHAFAGGGGGVEYFTNAGSDILDSLSLPEGSLSGCATGSIQGVSLFGYGITRAGWKIGGFGTFFFSSDLSVPVDELDGPVTGAIGGFGGVISGGYARLGPLTFALNLRLGAGGMGIKYPATSYYNGAYHTGDCWDGTFFFMGSADVELGIVLVPAMMISAYAGVDAAVTAPIVVMPLAVPMMGIRVTWGSF